MMVCLLTCDEFIWITDGKAVLLGPLLSTNAYKHSEFYGRRQGQDRVNRTKDLGRGVIYSRSIVNSQRWHTPQRQAPLRTLLEQFVSDIDRVTNTCRNARI